MLTTFLVDDFYRFDLLRCGGGPKLCLGIMWGEFGVMKGSKNDQNDPNVWTVRMGIEGV